MRRSDLVKILAESNPLLKQEFIEQIVEVVFEEIIAAMERGDRVELRGFGVFSARKRRARLGKNPRTGETVQLDERYHPFFRASKKLLNRINSS